MPNNKEFIKKNKKRGLRKISRRLNNQKSLQKKKVFGTSLYAEESLISKKE